MRITESKLRSIIRSVIRENNIFEVKGRRGAASGHKGRYDDKWNRYSGVDPYASNISGESQHDVTWQNCRDNLNIYAYGDEETREFEIYNPNSGKPRLPSDWAQVATRAGVEDDDYYIEDDTIYLTDHSQFESIHEFVEFLLLYLDEYDIHQDAYSDYSGERNLPGRTSWRTIKGREKSGTERRGRPRNQ